MAYEALNNVGASNKQIIVILNDNEMSIDRPVGAMSNYSASSKQYTNVRTLLKKYHPKLSDSVSKLYTRLKNFQKV